MTKLDKTKNELTPKFGMTETVFDFVVLDALTLAYATTIHKSLRSDFRSRSCRSPSSPTPCWPVSRSTPR